MSDHVRVRDYPRVTRAGGVLWLTVSPGRDYEVPGDPYKFMGLIHHLSAKTWTAGSFIGECIQQVAQARGWSIHPF
jgi:hypothetical protein